MFSLVFLGSLDGRKASCIVYNSSDVEAFLVLTDGGLAQEAVIAPQQGILLNPKKRCKLPSTVT